MLSDSLLNNVSDVFQGRGQLFHLIIAKSNVISDVALVTSLVESVLELSSGFLVFLFLVEKASLGNDCLGGVHGQLLD